MSSVLYYSNHCSNSKALLNYLSKTSVKNDIHFVCIDQRIKKNNRIYIVMSNGSHLPLPENVTGVPALLLLNKGNRVAYGEEILSILRPIEEERNTIANRGNGEPSSYAFGDSGLYGVASDQYSFLDQDASSMSAKGDGGLRQMHSYATIDMRDNIDTPVDNYVPDKIGSVDMEQLNQNRNAQVQPPVTRQ